MKEKIKSDVKPIILGGGLAGLSACYHSGGIIYEKCSTPGGHARSHIKNGFIFDEGIHVLHTSNEYVIDLLEKIGANLEIRERDAWIVSNGAMTRYPFQANTYGLPVDIIKDCLLGFIENDFTDRDDIKNYEDWIYFIFGKGIAEHFMIPYSKKFWGVEPKKLTTEWVNIRHPRPSMSEVITGALQDQKKRFGINGNYRYPTQKGFGKISEALANCCKDRINLNMTVTGIDVNKKEIEFNKETLISYETVLSSLPLPVLIDLIPDAPSDVREAAKKLKSNSIYVVNLGINRPDISNKNWIYYMEKEYSFIRVSFPFNQADSMVPEGTSSISAEITYGNDNPLPVEEDKIVDLVIEDLIKAGIITKDDEIIFTDTIDIKLAYILFDFDRKESVDKIHTYLKSKDIIPFGRYGLWAYLWSDEAILSGKKAAEDFARIF
jgi:UDP-galactopyranose mutase